jgi:hypothetical protein
VVRRLGGVNEIADDLRVALEPMPLKSRTALFPSASAGGVRSLDIFERILSLILCSTSRTQLSFCLCKCIRNLWSRLRLRAMIPRLHLKCKTTEASVAVSQRKT